MLACTRIHTRTHARTHTLTHSHARIRTPVVAFFDGSEPCVRHVRLVKRRSAAQLRGRSKHGSLLSTGCQLRSRLSIITCLCFRFETFTSVQSRSLLSIINICLSYQTLTLFLFFFLHSLPYLIRAKRGRSSLIGTGSRTAM
jgi:hypothetical protein